MKHRLFPLGLAAALLLGQCAAAFAVGAIAVDDAAGSKPSDAGFGVGYGDTKDTAQAAALKQCTSTGNDACRVVVWFDKCGAYASSNEKSGIGYASTEEAAKTMAMESCGNSSCRLVTSDCGD